MFFSVVLSSKAGVLWTEEDDFLLEDAFSWSEQQFSVDGRRRDTDTEKQPVSLSTRVGDLTRWIFLFGGMTRRLTLWKMVQITGLLALTSLLLFGGLIIGIKLCQPKDTVSDTQLHEYTMERLG